MTGNVLIDCVFFIGIFPPFDYTGVIPIATLDIDTETHDQGKFECELENVIISLDLIRKLPSRLYNLCTLNIPSVLTLMPWGGENWESDSRVLCTIRDCCGPIILLREQCVPQTGKGNTFSPIWIRVMME